MQWTEKQLDVINTRNKNILVSAAAGSGKTAVLVERIIRMITDHDRGIDIDKLLVVTFTRAAAAEMKERIREALEEIARVEPENGNVQRQLSLLHHADISTIDSFCASVVKDNFDKIDLDPNFRIADETEIEMLQSDIIGEMLEEYYTKGEKDFIRLAKQYSGGKISERLGELISQIYKFASGHHNPRQWVLDCGKIYGIKTIEEMNNAPWMKDFLHIIQKQMDSFLKELDLAFMISESENGPKYGEALTKMSEDLLVVKNCSTYDEMRNAVRSIGSVRLSGVRGCNPEKRQQVTAIKKEIADAVKKMKTDMFAQSGQELLEDIINSAQSVNSIVRLTLDFMERFDREKKEKGIMDFNDQAHYALKILNDEDELGNLIPSKTAGQMAEHYQEIMIDEYQDSNFVQEAILTSVSGGQGRGNLFMVGDVKQSIYRFRQAQPQLFLEKYNRYSSKPDKQDYKIILDKNFRSRREVVESVNYLFNYLMHRQVGGIDYKGENQLVMGAAFDEAPADQNQDTEFIIIEGQQRKAEAEFVAEKIKEITDPVSGMKITEPGKGQRVVTYGDIAILLRSVKGKSEVYMEHLENYGIPAYTESRTGYYQTMEVKTILSALSVIDNPRQDIPLTAVMVSPMFGFLEDELAQIRTENVAESFYDCVERYGENGSNDLLKEKTVKFLKTLHHLQKKVPYTSVYDLMNELLEKTGYGYYVRAMVNGERRLLNIEALKEKAVAYDAISYKGLFHFVRYIEKLKYLSKDDGEASVLSENDNTVHIMSIHKSKGLQYPIVFLCDTNTTPKSDTDQIVADENGIIGVDYIDDALKMKEPTIIKRVIKMKNNEEEKAEALRILYVALTRAKEKLYITGRTKNLEKTLLEYAKEKFNDNSLMFYHELVGHCSFMDLIGKTVGKNKAFCAVTGDDEMGPVAHHDMYDTDCCIQVHTVKEEELFFHEMQGEIHEEIERESLSCLSHSCYHNQETEMVIKENFSFQYPFMEDVSLHSKVSVTEIKKQSMSYEEAHDGQIVYEKSQKKPGRIPKFMSGRLLSEEVLRGAERGTAYHRVFELLDFERPTGQTNLVSDMIKDFVSQGMVTEQQAKAIHPEDIVIFTQSRLFRRMKLAWESGVLFRERKFLMEIPVREMNPHSKSEETMIVQGIIDVCFIEDGKYIIADYKTDKVENMEQLISRYKVQLQCYKQAIEQISGITVSEMIIYSVYLGEEGTI